jgi:uncharacterized iron-regulated protein
LPPSTRRFARAALASLALALLVACAGAPARSDPSGAAAIVDVAHGRLVNEDDLVDALAPVRFRLLGELHDDPEHHAMRARLVKKIAQRGLHPAVVFEQFDLEHDAALKKAQTANATPESLANAGQLDREGWKWPMHAPIVAAALAAHLPIRAGNLSRREIMSLTPANDDARAPAHALHGFARLEAARWSDAQERTLTEEIVEAHCNVLPARVVPRVVRAERMRDAAMAQALVDDATADGAILIAGDGHVRANLGVPVYLRAPGLPGSAATSQSVGFVERDTAGNDALDDVAIERLVAEHPGFDFLVVTPRIERSDPCAEFRAPR